MRSLDRARHAGQTLWLLVRRTAHEYSADNCSHMAAAISYYVLFSIVPLAIFLVSIFGLVVRDADTQERVSDEIVDLMNVEQGAPTVELDTTAIAQRYGEPAVSQVQQAVDAFSEARRRQIDRALDDGRAVSIAGYQLGPDEVTTRQNNAVINTIRGASEVSGALWVVGVAGMAWSASAMFGAIRKSLNIAWDTDVHRPIVQQKLVDLTMVVSLGVLLGLSIGGTTALRTLRALSDDAFGPLSTGTGFFWSVLPFVLPAVFSFFVFLFIYRYVPNAPTSFATVWPGALLATALFEIMKNLYALYIANFNAYSGAYGALGGVLLFLLWTYLTSNILLIGAEFAAEYPRVLRGEYDEEAQPELPGVQESLRQKAFRMVRGLFVHQRKEPEPPEPDAPAKRSG